MVLWWKKSQLGVDLGEFALKVCHLDSSRSSCKVFQHELLPSRESRDQRPDDAQLKNVIGAALKQVASETKQSTLRVNLSVQDHGLSTGYLELPPLIDRELQVAIPAAVSREIPQPLQEVEIFHVRVPALRQSENIGLFFLTSPKAGIAKETARFKGLGCEVLHVEPTLLSTVRGLTRNRTRPADEVWGAVSCGFHTTSVTLFRGPHPYFSRSFRIAGADFTYAFQMGEQVSWQEAEQMKRDYQVSTKNFHLEPFVQRWCAEVQRSLTFASQNIPELKPSQLLLTGGSARWGGLDERLSEVCGVWVERDRWNQLKPSTGGYESEIVLYEAALGLVSLPS